MARSRLGATGRRRAAAAVLAVLLGGAAAWAAGPWAGGPAALPPAGRGSAALLTRVTAEARPGFVPASPSLIRLLDRPAPHLTPPGVVEWGPLAARPMVPVAGMPDPPRLTARAAILVEPVSGAILYAKQADRAMHPASTTKMLTALLILERGSPDDVVTISARAARTPGSSMGLRAASRVRLEDLLYGILLASGNDAAVAAAEHLAGSVEVFAGWMNRRAWELGAIASHFKNPHGLTAIGHMTTARDLAILASRALELPGFREVVCTPQADVCGVDPEWHRILANTNRLLGREGVEGVKTGTTSAAGDCLVASAVRDGVRLISVVLDSSDRWADTGRLLEWGFGALREMVAWEVGEYAGAAPVHGGTRPRVAAVAAGRLAAATPQDPASAPEVRRRVHPVTAPVAAGDAVGRLELLAGGRVLGQVWLVAAADVSARRRWWPPWDRPPVRRPWPAPPTP